MRSKEHELIFVNIKGSDYIHAVLTPEYYSMLIKNYDKAPEDMYGESEYQLYTVPFSFTTLNNNLPFRLSDNLNLFLMVSDYKNNKDRALVEFHLEAIEVYRKYQLPKNRLWFDYIDDGKEYSIEFKELYDRFKQMCISTTRY